MPEKELETWQNVGRGRAVLKQFNQRGELHDVMITGGKVFHLTPKERRINEEIAANEDLNMFRNGMLAPVKLIETEEDAKELAENPNVMGETEMRSLFKAHHKTFEKRVGEIKNPVVLGRLRDLASEENATLKQVELIDARINEVHPKGYIEVGGVGA